MARTSFIATFTSAPLPGIIAPASTAIADPGGKALGRDTGPRVLARVLLCGSRTVVFAR